ncbi:alpha/beta hydrolase [Caenimonas sedimenti]|uniref:alpha/beta hydrolase n=1 Tax=Caenimonas sedimenti TaxID=2596921 RepID=UPI001646757E|nr:alpha/beta hydrolase [Caenimonas sedimenti]
MHAREKPLPLQRSVALLAYLALNPGPVPRTHLAALLWPDTDETRARARLRRLVYNIDEALGGGALLAEGDGLALAGEAVEVDALQFTRFARRAVAVGALDGETVAQALQWIGHVRRPLLQGIAFGSGAFDDWLKAAFIEHERLLGRLLERVIDAVGAHDPATALDLAEALIAQDPYHEPSYVVLMRLHARQGHGAGVEAAYVRCAEVLRAEFGIRPGPLTDQAYLRLSEDLKRAASHQAKRTNVRFAETSRGVVAYAKLGAGEQTMVIAPGFVSQIEIAMEHPPLRTFVESLAEKFQVIIFDRGGVGLSERLATTSTPAAMAADIVAILDHARVRRAWVFGSSEGGLGATRLAIDHPERVQGLCLFGSLARGSAAPDYPWALSAAAYGVWLKALIAAWGGPVGIETFAPSAKDDPALRAWWARIVRHAASPGGLRTILEGLRDTDMRADLHRIQVPALVMHRRGDLAVRFQAGEHLARNIPNALWLPLEGDDHFWWCGDSQAVLEAIMKFAAAR